ncbi:MAG: pyridoxal phosphate-dependent aminotransferase [Anaerolineales bacterium]
MKELKLNPQLLKVPLYVAGKSSEEVQEELGLQEVLKLASNENALGPSPMAVAAFHESLQHAHRYPGIAERELRRRLADSHGAGFSEEHFIIGNGGTDVLRMVAQAFIFEGSNESIMGRVTFPLYELLTTMYGGTSIKVDPTEGYALDLHTMAEAVGPSTRLVWFCSPDNPTGKVIEQEQAEAFLDRIPDHVVVVFDQSYCDYVTDDAAAESTQFVLQGRPVFVARSFSKSAGLANLRVGYGIAHPDLIEYLRHTVLPFNTGAPVIWAAIASMDDHDFKQRSRQQVEKEREFLFTRLSDFGLRAHPSQSNFVFVTEVPGGGTAFAEYMLQKGVIVRPMGAFGEPSAVRVTVGLREQNEQLLKAVSEVLEMVGEG